MKHRQPLFAGRTWAWGRYRLGLMICAGFMTTVAHGQTGNVFIVNIDGPRYTEGFGAGATNMPYIWDSLRPLGTTYSNFYNTGVTYTNSAHSTIVSGVRQLLQNSLNCGSQIRTRDPGIGEYFRRHTGARLGDAAYIDGKPLMWGYPASTAVGYGPAWAPTIVYTTDEDDWATLESTFAVINRNHPKLCYVLFGEVDHAGHTGDTAKYIGSIRKADLLTWLLWRKLQSDTVYRDRTTFIITNDHGRHDDAHGGWKNHGCYCRGCRHVMFLAIGPEIRADTVITTIRDQIDLAPTIGYLLGFPTPFAQGTIMEEMLKQPCASNQRETYGARCTTYPNQNEINLSTSAAHSRAADIARTSQTLHVVYADHSRGQFETYYTRSTDAGLTWSAPTVLFSAESGTSYSEPVIAAAGEIIIVAAAGIRWLPAETTFTWVLSKRRSTDAGFTWDSIADLGILETVSSRPGIAVFGNRVSIAAGCDRRMVNFVSEDTGATFGPAAELTADAKHYPQRPASVIIDSACAIWEDCFADRVRQYHDLWFDHEPWRTEDIRITNNDANTYSYQPAVTRDLAGTLHLAYSHLPDAAAGNRWQVCYRRSTDRGLTWTGPESLSIGKIGRAPAIRAAGGRLTCVWQSYEPPNWNIKSCFSTDQGRTWTAPGPMSSPLALSAEPRLAVRADTAYVVWEDNRDGNWEIYFSRHIFAGSAKQEENAPPPTVRNQLEVNPNPCRGSAVLHILHSTGSNPSLAIYDASGVLVRSLPAPCLSSASSVVWDGRDNASQPLPAGVYTCVLSTSEHTCARQLVLLR